MPIKLQDIVFYSLVFCFLLFFFYVLMSGRQKSKFRFGRARRVIKVFKQNPDLTAKQYKSIANVLQKLDIEFMKRGDVDYETMIDSLAKIARQNDEYTNVVTVLIDVIKAKHPYCCVSKQFESVYTKIEDEIHSGKADDACVNLRLLYQQHIQTEKSVKGISLAGFVFTTISLFIPILEKLLEFLRTLAE